MLVTGRSGSCEVRARIFERMPPAGLGIAPSGARGGITSGLESAGRGPVAERIRFRMRPSPPVAGALGPWGGQDSDRSSGNGGGRFGLAFGSFLGSFAMAAS